MCIRRMCLMYGAVFNERGLEPSRTIGPGRVAAFTEKLSLGRVILNGKVAPVGITAYYRQR
ncbi:hypothetical protein WN55_02850 [Dufourea novaeangliae]|uniref:Uncharacterized protein n=1 Tax=Dufourea novaeangliae TaxID=178035 RepID=A0A154PJV4_DUFNO|nr:hypothetical protein WN55_02850 [Dufourea novaeangliae]